jgi:adiponectin receptor
VVKIQEQHIRSRYDNLMDMSGSAFEPDSPSDSAPKSPKSLQDPYWPTIAHIDLVPLWLRDNDFILTGHPLPTLSLRKSFRLWCCLHNESVNIYSHFLGSAFSIATGLTLLGYVDASSSYPTAATGDRFAFASFFAAVVTCFGASATFHTLRSHSYNVHHFWGRMDILGINILALGGSASATYYAFYCNSKLQRIYWALVLTVLVVAV